MSIINSQNKKFAVVIGINYTGTEYELNGCVNDANHLKNFLITKCEYAPENILMLADNGINLMPTKQNILDAFDTIVDKAGDGFNEFWISYSGHGSHVKDLNGDESDGYDEVLCPVDCDSNGMIIDDYIYDNLVCKLPKGTTLFSVMDCCHSGTIYDLPLLYTQTKSFVVNNKNNRHVANVISISGCKDDQTSADAFIDRNYEGAMTWSFLNITASNTHITVVDLVNRMRSALAFRYSQIPMLAVSDVSQYDRMLMDDVHI